MSALCAITSGTGSWAAGVPGPHSPEDACPAVRAGLFGQRCRHCQRAHHSGALRSQTGLQPAEGCHWERGDPGNGMEDFRCAFKQMKGELVDDVVTLLLPL